MKIPLNKAKVFGVSAPFLVLAAAWMLYRSANFTPSAPAQSPEDPVSAEVSPEPEPTPEQSTETVEPPKPARVRTPELSEAQKAMDALVRQIQAHGWSLSKLPVDELNARCWMYRPKIQQLQNQFNGGQGIAPVDFVPYESVLTGEAACRLAFHYLKSGESPAYASTDISELEGIPNVEE